MKRVVVGLLSGLWLLPLAAVNRPPDLQQVSVVGGFSAPVAARHSGVAGDARLFVVEQGGRIRIVANATINAQPFLDFAANAPLLGFSSGGERGLLGLAFAPDYSSSGHFYVHYNDSNGDSVVARYQRDALDADRADPSSAAVLLRVDQDFSNHNGGDLHFGPDGMLYISLGDGGSGNDPCNRAQTLAIAELAQNDSNNGGCPSDGAFTGNGGRAESRALLGKLLRIDVSAAGNEGERCGLATASSGVASVGYRIPAGNPYAAGDGICDEVFLSGLRNPWRFSFDRDNGDLWIGDVGQSAREEIDRVPAGQSALDFGWRCREGALTTGNSCSDSAAQFTAPVLDYGRDIGQSITGGFRYRGPQQALQGLYFFADFYGAQMLAEANSGGGFDWQVWRNSGTLTAGFGEDGQGELYFVDYGGGSLFRLHTDLLFVGRFEAP